MYTMKTFAIAALSGFAAIASATPDHYQSVSSVLCTDAPAQTVTVYKDCTPGQTPGSNSPHEAPPSGPPGEGAVVTVTVTETAPPVTITETAGLTPPATTAATATETATGTTTAAGSTQTFHIDVGAFVNGAKRDFLFKPNNITANEGDVVLFNMLGASHSVTQSEFMTPCIKKQPPSFDTELQPNKNNQTGLIIEKYIVQSKKPAWFYCKQQGPPVHCGTGMVFGINPKSDAQMQTFIDMARAQNGTATTGTATGSATTSKATVAPVAIRGRRFAKVF